MIMMPPHRHVNVVVAAVASFTAACTTVHAFSSASSVPPPPPPPTSDGIKIVGLPGGQVQSLPSMYVNSFRRWIVDDYDYGFDGADDNSDDGSGDNNALVDEESCASRRMEPLEGAGLSGPLLDGGWANPTSTSELWWPRDLDAVQVRPALNVLFRNGMLSYVSAGLDVRVPHQVPKSSGDGDGDGDDDDVDDDAVDVVSWRNYGVNSQPIARQWTTLDIAMEGMFHVEGFILGKDDDGGHHEELFPNLDVKDAMRRVATFVAELDALSPLAEGFHIASFPMMENWTDLPSSMGASSLTKDDGGDEGEEGTGAMYRIVCIATSEPFASKLLDLDEDILTMSSTSVLEVEVSRTARGGDSPYLTEPYKGLYLA